MSGTSGGDYYVVYWYPTIFHRKKKRRDDCVIEQDFIDISDKSPLQLKAKKAEVGKDLNYTLLFVATGKEIPFELTFVKERKNGFVVYKYDRVSLREKLRVGMKEWLVEVIMKKPQSLSKEYLTSALEYYDDHFLDKYIDNIFISCYHIAKELYHKHEIQDSSDGRLKAYLKNPGTKEYLTAEPDISKPNHEAICFFIEQYEKLFGDYAQIISDKYSEVKLMLLDFLARDRKIPEEKEEAIATLNKLDKLERIVRHAPGSLTEEDTPPPPQPADNAISVKEFRESIEKSIQVEREEEDQWQAKNQGKNRNGKGKSLEELRGEIWEKENQLSEVFVAQLNSLQGMCGNALTEYNYCKSLLESKYNTEYKYDLLLTAENIEKLGQREDIGEGVTEEEQRNLAWRKDICDSLSAKDLRRKCAFNIRNCIRYIVEVRSKCGIWESEIIRDLVQKVGRMLQVAEKLSIRSEKNGKLSVRLGWLSAVLGVFGFVLSIVFGVMSCNSNCNCSNTPPAVIHAAADSPATTSIPIDSCSAADASKPTTGK
jgi:hypothetical protein